MANMEDKLGYVPAGTRFTYTAQWSLSALGELGQAGVITAQQIATQVKEEIQGGITEESYSGGSYFALFQGGNNVTLQMVTTIDFDSQEAIQAIMDAYVTNALGSLGDLSSSSITSYTLPADKTATDTGAPGQNTGWGLSNLASDLTKGVKEAVTPSLSTKVIGAGLIVILLLILLFYFLPAQGIAAAKVIRRGK